MGGKNYSTLFEVIVANYKRAQVDENDSVSPCSSTHHDFLLAVVKCGVTTQTTECM